MFDVSGKRAIITGGAQGFGQQFARRLLQKGCKVCITDIDERKGAETKKEFQEQFGIKDNRFESSPVTFVRRFSRVKLELVLSLNTKLVSL